MKQFFETHPAILELCRDVNNSVCSYLPSVKKSEMNFDLILPFLFEGIERSKAKKLSFELRIHREIVDYYNNGNREVDKLFELVELMKPVSYELYQEINTKSRNYSGNLLNSYLESTDRVYYRFLLLERDFMGQSGKNEIINQVKYLSAFLLFDDDIYDLEADIQNNKKTLLTQFLNDGYQLNKAIDLLKPLLLRENSVFGNFVKEFVQIYFKL